MFFYTGNLSKAKNQDTAYQISYFINRCPPVKGKNNREEKMRMKRLYTRRFVAVFVENFLLVFANHAVSTFVKYAKSSILAHQKM